MMLDFDRMVKVHSQSVPPGFPYGRLFLCGSHGFVPRLSNYLLCFGGL
nr:MAG TPA: Putative hydrogenase C-terminal has an alpha-beta.3A [Caudoviricetes sp.]